MSSPILMMISDRQRTPQPLHEAAARAAEAGVDFFQVREKDLSVRALRDVVASILAAVKGSAMRVLVNGRVDVAAVTGAQGVQLPEDGLEIASVKRAFPALLVSVSCHDLERVREADRSGADLIVWGPVFSTPGKESRARGIEPLREVCSMTALPVLAVGGVTVAGIPDVIHAGAAGIAAIRLFLQPDLETVISMCKASS